MDVVSCGVVARQRRTQTHIFILVANSLPQNAQMEIEEGAVDPWGRPKVFSINQKTNLNKRTI
jgi:hypothetical protein